ncbi:MAG: DUF3750 domain-containing protein [Patescibacteria group bacterium]
MNSPFEKLIEKDTYQVFLLSCPAYIPISFAIHPWFVVNKKGIIKRWEVGHSKKEAPHYFGYIRSNGLPLFKGLSIISYSLPWSWGDKHIKLLGIIEGDDGSLASKMVDFIEGATSIYPYRDTYRLTGPNSNTYVKWVLDAFPESGLRLPWNAFGKNFKK